MKRLFAIFLFCLVGGVAAVSAQTDQCFKNEGLKQLQTVSFTIKENKVEGTFANSGYDDANPAETVKFTGTKAGNLLTIKFQGKIPYERPPKSKTIVWTLTKTSLKIPIYGKNYETNKYSVYAAVFDKCKEE
jgi:hypothetical protein